MRSSSWLLLTVGLVAGCGGGGDDGGDDIDAGLGPIIEPGDPGAADVRIDVRADTARVPISPLIYGINGGADVMRDRPQVVRSGGNRLTAYNWENNASNAGTDYCNQNDGSLGGPGTPPASAYRGILDDARTRDTAAILTLPIIDVVAADHDDLGDGGQGPPACVGDVSNSGTNYLQTRFATNVARKGAAFATTPDLGDDMVFQDEAVDFVRRNYGDVRVLFSLDNEPDLWSSTHVRVHPGAVTYAELVERTTRFAAAAKDAWPEAEVLGFVSYGFAGYMNLQNAPDAAGRPFIPFFLDALRTAEQTEGTRLVDYLDLHWYPEARGDGVRISDVDSAQGAAARVQAPRSLWDATYSEDSWIVNDVLQAPIALIPGLKANIDDHYPGTKLSFTEWNYGGGDHVSGAIATADVLGVFGREQVDAATIWLLRSSQRERFTLAGLRAYTNYDGNGARFGDTSIQATSSDVARVTAYASDVGAGERQKLVLINKHTAPLTAAVRIASPRNLGALTTFVLDGDAASIDAGAEIAPAATNAFIVTLPASSVTVIDAF
jgi:hypothetical protein